MMESNVMEPRARFDRHGCRGSARRKAMGSIWRRSFFSTHTREDSMDIDPFELTTGELARAAGVNPDTVRRYANLNLIESRRLSSGIRIFRRSSADVIRQVCQQRLAVRGRPFV
jgi:hypothetical protein